MAVRNNNLKRVYNRLREETHATRKIAKVTSWLDATYTLIAKIDIQIMNRNGYKEYPLFKRHLLRKHAVMMVYFEKQFSDFLKSYKPAPVADDGNCRPRTIWVCWWQGEDSAPEIVKRCLESIRRNCPNYNVTVITEENYHDYVSFPKHIQEKKEKGLITRTHLSDMLRLELLSRYGGVWLDSTFLCTDNRVEKLFETPLWTIKRPDYFHASIASGYFAGYSLACDASNRRVFSVIRDLVYKYWEENDFMVDYLLFHYIIVLAQRHFSYVREAFDRVIPNNPMCDELYKRLAAPYDERLWKELKDDTSLFKLTWKMTAPETKHGKPTFYGALLNGLLK